jgi:hypothetical protein
MPSAQTPLALQKPFARVLHWGSVVHGAQVPASQNTLMQSVSSPQLWPLSHGVQLPPQSTSVSSPSCVPLLQNRSGAPPSPPLGPPPLGSPPLWLPPLWLPPLWSPTRNCP